MLLPVEHSALTFRAGIINFAFRMDVRESIRPWQGTLQEHSSSECSSDIVNGPNTSKVHFSSSSCVRIYLTAFSAWTQSVALRWPSGCRSRNLCLGNVCLRDRTVPQVCLNWAPCYNLQTHVWSLCFLGSGARGEKKKESKKAGEIILAPGRFLLSV